MAAIITSAIIILSIFFLLPWLYFLPKVSYGKYDLVQAEQKGSSRCKRRTRRIRQ